MSQFRTSYPKGEVARQIALLGLSQKEFAAKAGVNEDTLRSAIRGKRLQLRTFGRIHIALAAATEAPSLEEISA
jgi:DNA-directed RNA polymerase specialized sigma24 family protein